MLDIGSFDRRITVQYATTAKDDMGGTTKTWAEKIVCWSKVDYKDANTKEKNSSINSFQEVEFTIRNRGASSQQITGNNMRVCYPVQADGSLIYGETQYYNIIGVSQYGGRDKYKILYTELQTNNFRQQ